MSAQEELGGGVAVVTGAGRGLGEGFARRAAELGMKVVLADLATDLVEKVAADIRAAGGEALAVTTDVSVASDLERLAQITHETFGDVRLLVNNAGIETLGLSWEVPAAAWAKTMSINVLGAVYGVRAFAPRMLAAGKKAFIASVSSVGGVAVAPIQAAYVTSKHAVLAFSECLALEMELSGKPISVSVVCPGPVATKIFDDALSSDPGEVADHRKFMSKLVNEQGMSPADSARDILEGIAAGQFFVSQFPEMLAEMARERADHLRDLTRPHVDAAMRERLGL
jgi:NAD(P)-dependent dehydrogenase (short-subunit alcohol dehydrogenase family)